MKSTVILNSFKEIGKIQLPKGVELSMSGPRIYVKTDCSIAHYINIDKILQDVHNILKENDCNMWKAPAEGCVCTAPVVFGTQSSVYLKWDVETNTWSLYKISQELVETEKSVEDIKAFLNSSSRV